MKLCSSPWSTACTSAHNKPNLPWPQPWLSRGTAGARWRCKSRTRTSCRHFHKSRTSAYPSLQHTSMKSSRCTHRRRLGWYSACSGCSSCSSPRKYCMFSHLPTPHTPCHTTNTNCWCSSHNILWGSLCRGFRCNTSPSCTSLQPYRNRRCSSKLSHCTFKSLPIKDRRSYHSSSKRRLGMQYWLI